MNVDKLMKSKQIIGGVPIKSLPDNYWTMIIGAIIILFIGTIAITMLLLGYDFAEALVDALLLILVPLIIGFAAQAVISHDNMNAIKNRYDVASIKFIKDSSVTTTTLMSVGKTMVPLVNSTPVSSDPDAVDEFSLIGGTSSNSPVSITDKKGAINKGVLVIRGNRATLMVKSHGSMTEYQPFVIPFDK